MIHLTEEQKAIQKEILDTFFSQETVDDSHWLNILQNLCKNTLTSDAVESKDYKKRLGLLGNIDDNQFYLYIVNLLGFLAKFSYSPECLLKIKEALLSGNTLTLAPLFYIDKEDYQGWNAFCDMLQNSDIRKLKFNYNSIDDRPIHSTIWWRFFQAVTESNVCGLSLSGKQLDLMDAGAWSVLGINKENSSIQTLQVSLGFRHPNQLTIQKIQGLSRQIADAQSLRTFYLRCDGLGCSLSAIEVLNGLIRIKTGFSMILDAVLVSGIQTFIFMGGLQPINEADWKLLCERLPKSQLQELHLIGCSLNDKTAEQWKLFGMALESSKIKRINLAMNHLNVGKMDEEKQQAFRRYILDSKKFTVQLKRKDAHPTPSLQHLIKQTLWSSEDWATTPPPTADTPDLETGTRRWCHARYSASPAL